MIFLIYLKAIPRVRVTTTELDIPIGKAMILTCNGTSVPLPSSVTWSRNGTILNNSHLSTIKFMIMNSSLAMSTLIINNSSQEDSGNYVCLMENAYSSNSSQAVSVTILGNLSIQFIIAILVVKYSNKA